MARPRRRLRVGTVGALGADNLSGNLASITFGGVRLPIDEHRSRPRAKRGRFHFVQHGASRGDSAAVSHQRRKPFGLNTRRYAG
jgi:hypothetical protein